MQIALFDEMSKRAQERLFMGQVAREILASLADVEQQLDSYFRDPSRAAGTVRTGRTAQAGRRRAQHAGAGRRRVAGPPQRRTDCPDGQIRITKCVEGEFEALAHQLSGLGFFVDKLQYGPADLDQILNPKSAAPDAAEGSDGASVESELASATRRSGPAARPPVARRGRRTHARRTAAGARNDTAGRQAAGRRESWNSARPKHWPRSRPAKQCPDAAIADAVQGIGQAPLESLAPSADTVRLAEASQEEFDAELLEIFIEEAREVLENMASSTDAARLQPHSQDLLTTLRRGFHTLKGSGRMVGLRDLGEAAFSLEQVMNRWLASERDGTPELFDLLDGARTLFAGWVDQLANGDTRSPDHAWLQPACDAIQIADAESAVADGHAGGNRRVCRPR
jgi:chemosensory pili system protein ChpA (sensor histidine kinase/response regulator)